MLYFVNPYVGPRFHHHGGKHMHMGSIPATLKAGVKDGFVILVAQVATKRIGGLVAGFNPIKGTAGVALSGIVTALGITIGARKLAPAYARLAGAAAFAEVLRNVGASVPALAPFLSDYTEYGSGNYSAFPTDDGMGAWAEPALLPSGSGAMAAWAGDEEYAQ